MQMSNDRSIRQQQQSYEAACNSIRAYTKKEFPDFKINEKYLWQWKT